MLSSGIVGANLSRRTAAPEFKVGTPSFDNENRTFVYVGPATGIIAAAATCTVTGTFGVTNAAGTYTADAAFAVGDYGWVRKTTSPL